MPQEAAIALQDVVVRRATPDDRKNWEVLFSEYRASQTCDSIGGIQGVKGELYNANVQGKPWQRQIFQSSWSVLRNSEEMFV